MLIDVDWLVLPEVVQVEVQVVVVEPDVDQVVVVDWLEFQLVVQVVVVLCAVDKLVD